MNCTSKLVVNEKIAVSGGVVLTSEQLPRITAANVWSFLVVSGGTPTIQYKILDGDYKDVPADNVSDISMLTEIKIEGDCVILAKGNL